MRPPPFLFSEVPLAKVISDRLQVMRQAIEQDARVDVHGLVQRCRIDVPIFSQWDVRVLEKTLTHGDPEAGRFGPADETPGMMVKVALPFTGDAEIFRVHPQGEAHRSHYATITPGALHVTFVINDLDESRIQRASMSVIEDAGKTLDRLRLECEPFNEGLERQIRELIRSRRG